MRRESIRLQFPALFAYDGAHEFLSDEAALRATREERIRSVWPFMTRRVLAFSKTLQKREQVNFDPEDILSECYIALARKDQKWTPAKGRYITFAGAVIDSELCSVRDRSRIVESPRNSSCRIKEYQKEVEAGTISAKRLKTMEDIQRTGFGLSPIESNGRDLDKAIHDDPAAPIIAQEEADEQLKGLKDAIKQLAPIEADVLLRTAGIFGTERQPSRVVALGLGRPEWEVTQIKAVAMRKIRSYLTSPKQSAA